MEKINGRKLTLIFIFVLILLVIALLVGKFTYSYLGPTLSDDLKNQGEITASGDTLIFTKGNNLSLSATTDNFATGGTNLTSTTNPKVRLIASTKTNSASATYYVGVVINNNTYTYTTSDNTAEVILTIKDPSGNVISSGVDGLTYVTSGGVSGFDVTGKTGLFNIKTDYSITTTSSSTGTTHTWTFTLTFVNLSTDQSENENASMNIDIYLQKTKIPTTVADVCTNGGNLADCIVTLNDKSLSNLSNIYYHDNNLVNGAKDNSYRYAGTNPNNFVCFGSDASTCPTDNLYRIIGVIDGKVKLIKYDYANSNLLGTNGAYNNDKTPGSTYKGNLTSINTYYWNNATNTNIWSESLLNKTNLNTNVINNIGKNWANKIATTTWKVGGNTVANIEGVIPSIAYTNEITNLDTTTYSAKIGLMYVSDYGFAADQSAWTITMDSYGNTTNINWMYIGDYEWTISRNSDSPSGVFCVNGGEVMYLGHIFSSAVRPSFNLESTVAYVSGSGTQSDPIRIN